MMQDTTNIVYNVFMMFSMTHIYIYVYIYIYECECSHSMFLVPPQAHTTGTSRGPVHTEQGSFAFQAIQ